MYWRIIMKKIIAIIICLTLFTVLFAGCDSQQNKEAYDLYQSMNTAMKDVKSLDMDINVLMDITAAGSTISTVTEGNMKQIMKSAADVDMAMNLVVSMMGTNTPTIAYYTGGIYYFEVSGMKMKMPMSLEDALQQSGGVETLNFPESAIKDCKITDVDDGKKIELTLDGKEITSLTAQILETMQSFSAELTETDMNYGDIKCEVVIDKDNMMKSYRIACDVTMTVLGESMGMKMDTSMTVNSYNDVTIEFPSDLDTYEEMTY